MTSDVSPQDSLRTRVSVQVRTQAAHRIALVSFEAAPGALVTWTPAALRELHDVLAGLTATGLTATDLAAVAFIGSGTAFGAGADLNGFTHATLPADGERIAREGYHALNAISKLGVPTFAFLNGTTLGGALELALRCDYRTVTASARAIGLPEARLGLVPGWGGLSSLATLVGASVTAEIALVRSLADRHLTAADTLSFGVTDAVLENDDFLAASLAWATQVLDGTVTVGRHSSETGAASTAASTAWSATAVRAAIAQRTPGALPAVEAGLDLLTVWQQGADATSSDVTDRTLARLVSADPIEDAVVQAFGTLLQTDECRASLYAFVTLQAARKRSRAASENPRPGNPATRVGVIGGGVMATQLAVLFADRLNTPVHLTELTAERANLALDRVRDQLQRQVTRGALTPATRDRITALITASATLADQAGSTLVIEAAFEDLAVKRGVWAEVEAVVTLDCVLLTNTSSLSITEQGADLLRPERLVGFHFFNPVAVLPLVEIVRSTYTSADVVEFAFGLAGALGKTAVLVADQAGFVVNRVLTRLFSDTLALIDAGMNVGTVDGALRTDGLPMTALTLLGYIGPAVQLHILHTMHEYAADRFLVSPSLVSLVDAGLPGYLGRDGALTPEAAALLAERAVPAGSALPATQIDVRAYLLYGLADEVARMLADGTVATPADIDTCMMLGANYPQHTGGLTPLLDRSGASRAATGAPFHPHGVTSVTSVTARPEPALRP